MVAKKKEQSKPNVDSKIETMYEVLNAYRLDLDSVQEKVEKMSNIVKRLKIRAGL